VSALTAAWIGHRPATLTSHLAAVGVTIVDGDAPILFVAVQPGEKVSRRTESERWRVAVIPGTSWDSPDALVHWLDAGDFDDAIAAERWPAECFATLRRALRHEKVQRVLAVLEDAVGVLSTRTEDALEQLEASVRMATGVQRVLLSRMSPRFSGVSLQFKYVPGKGSGGDYYDFLPLEDGRRFVLLLADGKSHGVVASLLSELLRLSLSDVAALAAPPTRAIEHFQKAIVADGDEVDAIALSLAVFDRPTLTLTVASTAPKLLPALFRGERWVQVAPGSNGVVQLLPGDRLCFATGGVSALHREGLLALLEEVGGRDALDTQNETMARVRALKGLPNDLTFLQVTVDPKALFVAG